MLGIAFPLLVVAFVTKNSVLKSIGFLVGIIFSALAILGSREYVFIQMIAVAFCWLFAGVLALIIRFLIKRIKKNKTAE